MRPGVWAPPVALSAAERPILTRIRRAKLFVFLRLWRHQLFTPEFQAELAAAYPDRPKGQPPLPPARLALATLLQAYTGVSDDEVLEATVMDRRWQLALDCLGAERAPFSKGTLVGFRQRLIAHDLDRRLVERTVELAERVGPRPPGGGGFSPRALRAALDSSPLWGAGRVEDTYNLLGHALRKALALVARQGGRPLAEVATAAGAPVLGGTSLKAALDLDWDDPAARERAVGQVPAALEAVEGYLAAQPLALAPPPAEYRSLRVLMPPTTTGPAGPAEGKAGGLSVAPLSGARVRRRRAGGGGEDSDGTCGRALLELLRRRGRAPRRGPPGRRRIRGGAHRSCSIGGPAAQPRDRRAPGRRPATGNTPDLGQPSGGDVQLAWRRTSCRRS